MTVPVLALNDPEAASLELANHFGFRSVEPGIVSVGGQEISLVRIGTVPSGMIPLRIDHVALAVSDADVSYRRFSALGARLDARFTPDGPRTIPEFWENGARFVFFEAPEGWPLEFCARTGVEPSSKQLSHDHYGIRVIDIEYSQRQFEDKGAVVVASHQLVNAENVVNVSFLQWGEMMIELFDEAPFDPNACRGGWIGVLDR